MKRLFIIITIFITFINCLFSQHKIKPKNYDQAQLISKYVMYDEDSIPLPVIPKTLYDKSISSIYFFGVKDIKVKETKRYKPFNPQKDDISNVVVSEHHTNGICEYELIVLHDNGKKCDMNEFDVRIESNNLVLREGTGTNDYYDVNGTFEDYLQGKLSMGGNIVITHTKSNVSTKIHYSLIFKSSEKLPGKNGAYLFEPIYSSVYQNTYSFLDLENGDYSVVKGPFSLFTSGKDGKNGRDGSNGSTGMNEYDWTDKEGKKHHTNGTCGTAGKDGQDGENGQDGGNSFVFVAPGANDSLTVYYSAGRGGKGGRGGWGGTHGKGSSCQGAKAMDGRWGRDGVSGKIGSVQFEDTKYENIMGLFNSSYQMKKQYCTIVINKSIKKKKNMKQPKKS